MITASISIFLFVLGGLTALLALQFLFPRWYSWAFNKIDGAGDALQFYARQGGLAIAAQGALLIWAAFEPSLRLEATVLVGSAKLLFVVTILLHLKKFPGLLVSALVDSVAVLILGAFLLGL